MNLPIGNPYMYKRWLNTMAKFNPGERVTDLQTGKNGVILDVCQPQRGRQLYRVLFENIAETKLEQNLETFFEQDNPFACLKKGLYGNRDQFMLINTTYKINNSNNNTLSSLKASKTLFKAYQFKPLLKFVNSPTQRILIADEVGLGKTIEAGHILLELKARDEFKTALIVCPNSLKIKWQTELKEKFGLAFKIYDSLDDVIEDLKAHPQNARGILNYEKIRVKESDETEEKSNDLIEFLNSNGQKYSIVLCDEAHKLRNDDTLSYKGMTGILEVTDAAIFLTATPLMLGENDLYNLLHLLEPLYYDNQNVFQNSINANKPFVKALAMLNAGESLHQIKELLSTDIITQRQVIGKNDYLTKCTVQEQYSGIPLYEKIINSLEEPDSLSLRARLQDYISSISPINNVFSRTRKREISTDERQQTERDAHKCSVILSDEERKIFDEIIDSYIEPNSVTFETEDGEEKVFYTGSSLGLIQQKRMVSSSVFGCKFYTENPGDVAAFCAQVEKESAVKDAKIECLVNIFDGIRQTQSSKVIVFSIFKFTVRYLSIRLKKIGYETFVIHGDIPIDEREKIIQEFKRSKKFAVLLATEVGSEGLDLQFCAHLVNYDLPWNPMVVEQRIGRIDRFGQKAPKVNIYNFVVYDSIQEEIYTRLLERIGIFQGAIGELEMILEENDDFKQLEKDFYGTNLSPEAKEQKFRDIEKAIETQKIQLEQVEKGMVNTLTNDIYFQNEINKIRSYRLYVTEDELRNYIQMLVSEHLTTCNFRALNDNEYVFTVPKSEQRALDSFLLKNQPQGEDFANLFGNYRRQIMDNMQENGECVLTFDQSYAFDNKAIDFVNIYNPIIIAASVYFKKNLERIGKTFRLKYNAPAHIPIEKGLYCMAVYSVSVHRNVYGKQVSSDRLVPILYSVKEDCIIENEDLAMQIFGEIQEKATYLSPDEDIENFNECTLDGIESDFCDHISSFVNREIESLRLKDESLRVIQKRQEEEYYDTRIRKEEQNIVDIKYELEQLEDSTNAIKKLQLAENRLNLIKAKRDNALEKINSVQTPTMESKLVSLSKLLIF